MRIQTSLAAMSVLAGATAHAQAEPQPDDVLAVTAVRAATPIERLPASITVIDRTDIELQGDATLVDALSRTPGLALVQSGPAGSLASVFVRGANSKHTLALYDGIRLNDPSSASGVFNFGSDLLGDAARIEVVRGPLSSLYGSDAIGGVINVLPRTGPETGAAGFGELAVGEFNTLRALAGGGYGGARLRLAASVEHQTSDGFDVTPARLSTANGDPDPSQFAILSANAALKLTDALAAEALLRHRDSEVEFDTFSGGASGFQRADDPDLKNEDSSTLWSLGLRYGAGAPVESRLRVGQVLSTLDSFNDGVTTDVFEGERSFAQWTTAWRPTGLTQLIDPLISAGVEWQREDIDTDTAFNAPLSVNEDAWSAFAAAQIGIVDGVDLTASVRFDDYDAFGSNTTANLGAVYEIAALNTRLRASVGTSFKAPTLSERFASSAFITPNPDLEPETGETVELGFDTEFALGGRPSAVVFGAAWYDSEIEDLIETVFDFTTFTGTNENIGAADLRGYEAYAVWTPADPVSLRVDYAYTDATNAETGARLLRRPPHVWTISGTWRPIEIATLSAVYRHFGERTDVLYDDAGFFASGSGILSAFETVDVSGTLNVRDRVQLFLTARNLFDETYEQPAAFAGAPRAVTLGVRVRS